ncbi:hypothetical protein KR018_008832 [Drosophila ironensis]|nr:hypothetical protein KR018_008832 [Drosophila ironensis]
MCKFLSLAVLLLVLAVGSTHSWSQNSDMTYCSNHLSEVLSRICREFNSVIPHKRSGMLTTELDPLDPIQYVESEKESDSSAVETAYPYQFLFGGRLNGEGPLNSLAALHRRTREGIADRCCKSKCSFSILSEYCSVPQ